MRSRHRCPACGAPVTLRQKFCSRCGFALAASERVFSTAGQRLVPTPTHLAERIRNILAAPEDERKQVTILFADVVGSTALIRRLDPERVVATLDPVLEEMTNAVHSEGGLVSRIQGNGIMALFGVPLADENHALRACSRALTIRDAFNNGLQTRVGLNSGEVVLRAVRNYLVVDYDAVGQAVHLAARMEQHARPGSVFISDTTARLVEGAFQLDRLGALRLRGAGRVNAFRLIGKIGGASRWRMRTIRGLNLFVGREREVGALTEAAAGAEAGLGGAVIVMGPAGAGKSRLVHELTSRLSGASWQVLEAAAGPEDEFAGYRPLVGMLRDWIGADQNDGPEATATKLLKFADGHGQSAHVPPLLALLDLPVADAAWNSSGPTKRRRAISAAFCSITKRLADRHPMLLVLEDVHWFGQESRELFAISSRLRATNEFSLRRPPGRSSSPTGSLCHTSGVWSSSRWNQRAA